MSRLCPVPRRELIRRFRRLGFEGPFEGGRHQFMERRDRRVILPNPHRSDISVDLLSRLLRQAEVDLKDWHESA
jgi:predicted RNA binding protein YcfA (HicA-like mRNA interferase family)